MPVIEAMKNPDIVKTAAILMITSGPMCWISGNLSAENKIGITREGLRLGRWIIPSVPSFRYFIGH